MQNVQLEYNPYIMTTEVKFNGRPPRINSLVEKYTNGKLQDWLNELPEIFHDEMNGYGFELEFTGPTMDFELLEKTFASKGISDEQVKLFHKNELASREQKEKDLREFLVWMSEEKNNGIFDYEKFSMINRESLKEDYLFITINGDKVENPLINRNEISVENVDSTEELSEVELGDTPIIVYVTREMFPRLQRMIDDLKQRKDVDEKQLFFILSNKINKEMTKRTISDLGIKKLQIVDDFKDKPIRDYYYAYPVTDYLIKIIGLLDEEGRKIKELVEEREETSVIKNGATFEKINKIEDELERLKNTRLKFRYRDNVELPEECKNARERLDHDISRWKKKKVKFTDDELEKVAKDFAQCLIEYYEIFISTVKDSIEKAITEYNKKYEELYLSTKYDKYAPPVCLQSYDSEVDYMTESQEIVQECLIIKEEETIYPRTDFIEWVFGNDEDGVKEPIIVTYYYYQEWREHAIEKINELANHDLRESFKYYESVVNQCVDEYINHLSEEIEKKTEEKSHTLSQLSDDELNLQQDVNWSNTFEERLNGLKEVK